jgi:predicted HicB family RNase H-like nuclease
MTRKEIKVQAARYIKFVEWSDEDRCFIGWCPELMLGGVHGNDEAKVYAELCDAVEEMIQLIAKDGHRLPEPVAGKDFSGRFVLRLEPGLHRRLAAKALAPRRKSQQFLRENPHKDVSPVDSPGAIPYCSPRRRHIRQPHFGILAREEDAVRACPQAGRNRGIGVFG